MADEMRGEGENSCWYSEGNEWAAWHDRMPGGAPTLYVTGVLTCPTPSYELRLVRAEPQGINPRDLRLLVVETRPSGNVPQLITPTDVSQYRDETEEEFDTVSIENGPTIEVRPVS